MQEASEAMLVMWFEMLYAFSTFFKVDSSNLAAFHAKRVTIMPKDARLIARIIGIWDPTSFLGIPRQTTFNENYDPKVTIYKQKCPNKCKHNGPNTNTSAPSSRKAVGIKRPNNAKHMSGGKTNNMRKELAAKAATVVIE